MVAGVSAIAAGGVYHQPRDRRARRRSPTARSTRRAAAPDRRVMSASAARTMLGIMRGVTERAAPRRRRPSKATPWAARRARRRRSPTVTTIRPSGFRRSSASCRPTNRAWRSSWSSTSRRAGTWAAPSRRPIFKEIAEQALRYLHVPPTSDLLAVGKETASARRRQGDRSGEDAGGDRGGRDGGNDAPPTDLPARRRWARRRSGAGREMGRGRGGRRGCAAGYADAPIDRIDVPDFAGMTLGAGDPRGAARAASSWRSTIREGRGDRRGAAAAARGRAGAARRGLPRGFRTQGRLE